MKLTGAQILMEVLKEEGRGFHFRVSRRRHHRYS
jgi:single-stranded DNA-specific DHH superfamily exonuclease